MLGEEEWCDEDARRASMIILGLFSGKELDRLSRRVFGIGELLIRYI